MGTHLGRNESSVRSDQNQILQNLSVVNFVRGGGKVPWLRSRNRRVQVRHVRSTKAVVVGLSLTRAIERQLQTIPARLLLSPPLLNHFAPPKFDLRFKLVAVCPYNHVRYLFTF